MSDIGPITDSVLHSLRMRLQDRAVAQQWAGYLGEPFVEALLAKYKTTLALLKLSYCLLLILLGVMVYFLYTRCPPPIVK